MFKMSTTSPSALLTMPCNKVAYMFIVAGGAAAQPFCFTLDNAI
jgi:hypothetical protein